MKNYLKYKDIENKFFEFFMKKEYVKYDAIPINSNDNNTFFTIAGMKQFVDIFLQQKQSTNNKIVNSQPCIRLTDLHNNTSRHTSLFFMLGLFRFDLKFDKKEVIQDIYDFYKSLDIDMNRIYMTTHVDKNQDFQLACDVNNNKVIKMVDNFWSMGNYGPCGSCVEFYYNYTDKTHLEDIKQLIIDGTSDILEIGNVVFIDQTKTPNGIESLNRTFVDTGLGLSRISQIINNKDSVYETDIVSLRKYIKNKEMQNPIIDALITSCFIMKEGTTPGPEGRNYILRKILRKALFYEPNVEILPILEELYEIFQDFDFISKKELIGATIQNEKELFSKVIEKSEKILNECKNYSDYAIAKHTYGVPMELIEIHVKHDEEVLNKIEEELNKHRQISMKHSNIIDFKIATNVCFYDKTHCDSVILHVEQREDCTLIITKDSCFYPTSGGQQGDKGTITLPNNTIIQVKEARKQTISYVNAEEFTVIHICEKTHVNINELVKLQINEEFRNANTRAHSALHIFAEAIMRDLNVQQIGSYVCDDYARIDLSVSIQERQSLMEKYIKQANECIQKKIKSEKCSINTKELTNETMYDTNGQYGSIVRKIVFEGYSNQLCGGTHVNNTADIKEIKLKKISSIGANKTRIEIICGNKII